MRNHFSIVVGALLAATLSACGTNPVTGKRELQLVSEGQEIGIGQQNYAPARQSQGGDYILDAELTAYINQVGQKLAAVADRKLPYEFVILNDSVPNAWAMPGGKIAFNRGLLYELNSEAELAAVLGHEIVHAAARHGAKGMERGLLLQGAIMAVGIGTSDSRYSQLFVGGAQVAAQLTNQKYGRDAELESDLYGMRYMKQAGYDPRAAIALQETFVRLSAGKQQNWLEGLFASHPPSEARVEANRKTAAELGEGGEMGREIYQQKTANLRKTRPAYAAYDRAVQALAKGDAATAAVGAQQALAIEPREARFHELLGDVALSGKRFQEALPHYEQAIKLQPDYFKPHVQSGIALFQLGRKQEASTYLTRANQLLPTAPGHYLLGLIAEEGGDVQTALKHFEVAAGSQSEVGKRAAERYVRIDLPRNPGRYLRAAPQLGADGVLYAAVQNTGPVPIGNIQVRIVRTDGTRVLERSAPATIATIAPGKIGSVAVGRAAIKTQEELKLFQVLVENAAVAQ